MHNNTFTRLRALIVPCIALLALVGCRTGPASKSDAAASQPPKRVAIVLTNHGQLGDTGKPTGFYLSEASHPYTVFRAAGWEVDFLSPKGGLAPMDGVDRGDPINAAFLDDEALVARTKSTTSIAKAMSVAEGIGQPTKVSGESALTKA